MLGRQLELRKLIQLMFVERARRFLPLVAAADPRDFPWMDQHNVLRKTFQERLQVSTVQSFEILQNCTLAQ